MLQSWWIPSHLSLGVAVLFVVVNMSVHRRQKPVQKGSSKKVKSVPWNKTFRILSFPFSHCLPKRFLNQCPWRSEERRRREGGSAIFEYIVDMEEKRGWRDQKINRKSISYFSPFSLAPGLFSGRFPPVAVSISSHARARTFSFSTSVSRFLLSGFLNILFESDPAQFVNFLKNWFCGVVAFVGVFSFSRTKNFLEIRKFLRNSLLIRKKEGKTTYVHFWTQSTYARFRENKNRLCSKTCGVDEKQNLVEGWG